MRAGQLAGWGILIVIVCTVYSLSELHRLSAKDEAAMGDNHGFAIDFGHMSRRQGHRGFVPKPVLERPAHNQGSSGGSGAGAASVPGGGSGVHGAMQHSNSNRGGGSMGVNVLGGLLKARPPRTADKGVADFPMPKPEILSTASGNCYAYRQVDEWGIALPGSHFKASQASECCAACLKSRGLGVPDQADCNVWVWCGDARLCGAMYQDCWLKWLPYIRVAVPKEVAVNGSLGWTSGTSVDLDLNEEMHGWKLKLARKQAAARAATAAAAAATGSGLGSGSGRGAETGQQLPPVDPISIVDTALERLKRGVREPQVYHTVTSVQGAYNQWQTRIHWYHWRKMQALCRERGRCEMGGYTRLLHSGKPDNIMDEIPTVVVDPMPSSLVKHDDYVVLNRPYAFVTWISTAKIPERYVLMAEPDHIYLRPLPNFMTGDKPAGFNFGYMNPAGEENCVHVKRHTGIRSSPQCEEVAPIGNSPTFLTVEDMRRVMPLWLNLSVAVYKDKEATKTWGWVQEMYAFAMAVWSAGIKSVDVYGHLVAQPPYDSDYELMPGRPFYILHYTYGLDFNTTTGQVLLSTVGDWHFDKREHDPQPIPRNITEPPSNVHFPLARALIRAFNEATGSIPCWNSYRNSYGKEVTKDCGEKPGGFLATLSPSQ